MDNLFILFDTSVKNQMIRVAYGSVPKDGGTFTFYRNQRPPLVELGVDLRCVTIGREQAKMWQEDFADEGCVLLVPKELDPKRQSIAFADWCEKERIDIVIGINSPAILSSLPHLPQHIRAMARCANAFDEGYRVTIACYERLAKIVALTPRLWHDLTTSYGVEEDRLVLIPNGICPDPYLSPRTDRDRIDHVLRLGFLGRLEHQQKGVLFLPDIVKELHSLDVSFKLRIAGTGKHEPELRKSLESDVASGNIEFVGAIKPSAVPDFLSSIDVYLFTSQFEGCPNALLEAMMAGAVPVAWKIDGITDFILDSPEIGTLCDLGDCKQFARAIAELNSDRERLGNMSNRIRDCANRRFTQDVCASKYANLFRQVMDAPPPPWTPVPWNKFKRNSAFAPRGWRRFVGVRTIQFVKSILRKSNV